METTLYKHGYLFYVALTLALLISSSTAMVFAAETATIKQSLSQQAVSGDVGVENVGRFIVTPKTMTFVRADA